MRSSQRRDELIKARNGHPLRKLIGSEAEKDCGGKLEQIRDGNRCYLETSRAEGDQRSEILYNQNKHQVSNDREFCAIVDDNINKSKMNPLPCNRIPSTSTARDFDKNSNNDVNSNNHVKSNDTRSLDNNINFTQTMYNLTTMQYQSNRRYAYSSALSRSRRQQPTMTTSATKTLRERLTLFHRPSLASVIVALALASSILIAHTQAYSTSGSDSASEAASSSASAASSASSPISSSAASSAQSPASAALSAFSSALISAALQDGKSSSSNTAASGSGGSSSSGSQSGASESAPSGSLASSVLSAVASPAASASASPSGSSSSAGSSIAASLSSAVASAAAAAAVAAAQNSLSGGDARSLLSGTQSGGSILSGNSRPNSHHRNQGLNLALKIVADAIPEVPYNILHNMKKLDHAAPFYNVGNKVTNSGSVKESSAGLLASALHSSGGLGGAAEHLSSLFRSPIWKRIADGYGEFTSEFRSLLKAPAPTTMKGPTSSTTKLLRDISFPALLMILASTIPSDWRPVRTRRKSLMPSDLAPAAAFPLVDPMSVSASDRFPAHYPAAPLAGSGFNLALHQYPHQPLQQQQQQRNSLNPLAQMYNQLEQSAAAGSNAQARALSDINLQQPVDSTANWIPPMLKPSAAQTEAAASSQQNNYNLDTQMLQQQQPQIQQSVRRFGDSAMVSPVALIHGPPDNINTITANEQRSSEVKPVNGERSSLMWNPQYTTTSGNGLFSSLTSSLANHVGQSKLMSRLMNLNVASGANENSHFSNSFKTFNHLMDENKIVSARRDHLNDKHRYSLVDLDNSDSNEMNMHLGNNMNEQQQPKSSSAKSFAISTMSKALGSMFHLPLESGSSGSQHMGMVNRKMYTLNGDIENHNHHNAESLLRRNQRVANSNGVGMEQRDLSQFVPQSWREVVKRTVNSVQQQATTQWKSFEGQLTNWVQDKLKTLPSPASASSQSTGSSGGSNSAAPVANIIASVSSTAMNLLGLGGKSAAPINAAGPATNSSPSAAESGASGSSSSSMASEETPVLKNKNDSANRSKQTVASAKGALAGVANIIVNSLTSRHSGASSSTAKSKGPSSSGESSSLMSQYPTQTGVQTSQSSSVASPSASSSSDSASTAAMASGTASTIAGMSLIAA